MLSERHIKLYMSDLSLEDLENLEKVRNDRFIFRDLEDIEAFRRLFQKCLTSAEDEDYFPSGEIGITADGWQILECIEPKEVL